MSTDVLPGALVLGRGPSLKTVGPEPTYDLVDMTATFDVGAAHGRFPFSSLT